MNEGMDSDTFASVHHHKSFEIKGIRVFSVLNNKDVIKCRLSALI